MRAALHARARTPRFVAVALPPLGLALALLASAPATGCRGASVRVPTGGVEAADPREAVCVDYPPPAARAEEIPAPPSARAVWIDGAWSWRVHRWIWEPGGWTEPRGAFYVQARLARQPNGALAWWPGHWHAAGTNAPSGETTESEPSAGPAATPSCPTPPRASLAASAGLAGLASARAAPADAGPTDDHPADAPSSSGPLEPDASIASDGEVLAPLVPPPP